MRLTIFGSGYVGLVTGACMAETGNHVVCVDIDEDKIKRLNDGEVTIYEPGLDDYIELARGRNFFKAQTMQQFGLEYLAIGRGTMTEQVGLSYRRCNSDRLTAAS